MAKVALNHESVGEKFAKNIKAKPFINITGKE